MIYVPEAEQNLVNAILDDPFDDTPRLVYADWLDEHGRPDRAAEIRVAVADPKKVEIVLLSAQPAGGLREGTLTIRRGFGSELETSCRSFLRYAAEIAKWWPLTRVAISDRMPARIPAHLRLSRTEGWAFFSGSNRSDDYLSALSVLPPELNDACNGYQTDDDARNGLSWACLSHLRKLRSLHAAPTPGATATL